MITWYRGETRSLVLTVTVDGSAVDLSGVTEIEYQLKAAAGDPDPALISLSIGDGIVLRAQSGATLGQADITISSTMADALAPGVYVEEVVAVFPGDIRKYVIPPRNVDVVPVVNRR